jgi:hypothetical protein
LNKTTNDGTRYIVPAGEQNKSGSCHVKFVREISLLVAAPLGQQEIVRRVESALTWIDRLTADATSARTLIDRLDQSSLVKAFRGEIVPQDLADESAGVLLERVRAEKVAPPKAGKTSLTKRNQESAQYLRPS